MPKRKNSPFIYTIIGMLIAISVLGDYSLNAACTHSPLANHFTCHFHHANIFHLAANAFCLSVMRPSPIQMLLSYPIAVLSTFFTHTPTVGISAMIYAYIGLNILRWRMSNIDILFFIIVNLITLFIPNIASFVHIVACILGMMCYVLYKKYAVR